MGCHGFTVTKVKFCLRCSGNIWGKEWHSYTFIGTFNIKYLYIKGILTLLQAAFTANVVNCPGILMSQLPRAFSRPWENVLFSFLTSSKFLFFCPVSVPWIKLQNVPPAKRIQQWMAGWASSLCLCPHSNLFSPTPAHPLSLLHILAEGMACQFFMKSSSSRTPGLQSQAAP